MVRQNLLGAMMVVMAIGLLTRSGNLDWLAVLLPVSLALAFVAMPAGPSATGFTGASKKG